MCVSTIGRELGGVGSNKFSSAGVDDFFFAIWGFLLLRCGGGGKIEFKRSVASLVGEWYRLLIIRVDLGKLKARLK